MLELHTKIDKRESGKFDQGSVSHQVDTLRRRVSRTGKDNTAHQIGCVNNFSVFVSVYNYLQHIILGYNSLEGYAEARHLNRRGKSYRFDQDSFYHQADTLACRVSRTGKDNTAHNTECASRSRAQV